MATTYFRIEKPINNTKNAFNASDGEETRLSLTRYCGQNGEFLQLTLGHEYICLNTNQVNDLIYNLIRVKHEDNLEEV